MPPRTAPRGKSATPARTPGPTVNILQNTPTRRSARATSRPAISAKDVVANPALPEIHTQQSYAYGASKAPALPEQINTINSMTMRDVAARINTATEVAERRFEAHAAVQRKLTPDPPTNAKEKRAQRRASKGSDEESSETGTPEQLRKTQRTAAWATSLDDSQLDDIAEEESTQPSPESQRADTDPSSFPSGIFNHSYNYERGLRGPKTPPSPGLLRKLSATIRQSYDTTCQSTTNLIRNTYRWLKRLLRSLLQTVSDLPDSKVLSALFKTFIFIGFTAIVSLAFCSIFTRTCDSGSRSVVSQALQSFCGSCASTSQNPYKNITLDSSDDLSQVSSVLQDINHRMHSIESRDISKVSLILQDINNRMHSLETRLGSQIADNYASTESELNSLRKHHSDLEVHIQRLQDKSQYGGGLSEGVSSPLISKINFFSPANGALIDPYSTSPTRQKPYWLPSRIVMRALGIMKYQSKPPITALTPWQSEGDCWCASTPITSQNTKSENLDSARLGITVKDLIYPTELIIEHFPAEGSIMPEIAPKDIELWADFSHLMPEKWKTLHISDLQPHLLQQPPLSFSFSGGRNIDNAKSWARIAQAQYAMASSGHMSVPHVQTFSLDINQNGLIHSAQRFVVRVLRNHGGDFTCLYRVRLHGTPVKERQHTSNTDDKEEGM